MPSSKPPGDDKPQPEPSPLSPGRRIENLLEQLQAQTHAVRDTWKAGESARLRILAAQLTSVVEGKSNAKFSEFADELEQVLLAEEAEASAICERIEELIQQCKKAASTR